MISPAPPAKLPVVPTSLGLADPKGEPSYPEPEFSRRLLFLLITILTLAQTAYEGIRFGLQAGRHTLVLPLLDISQNPAALRGDPIHALAPFWASPFWSLLASLDESLISRSLVFALILVIARWASAVAIFRISERSFGHPLAALLAAVLWLGLPSVGGVALHHDFLAGSDVSLALLLWALVLWKEEHDRWALFCGLAACVDAPLGLLVFVLLWAIGWLRLATARHPGRTEKRRGHFLGLFWFALGSVPLWPAIVAHFDAAHLSEFSNWFASLQSGEALLGVPLLIKSPWVLPVFLIIGAWCWKKASRPSPPAKMASLVAWSLILLVVVSAWLLQSQLAGAPLLVLFRAAPLALALYLIAMARMAERGGARRGSFGFALIWLWTALVVFLNSTFYLVAGVLLLELLNLLARRHSPGNPVKASPVQDLVRFAPTWRRDAGRWALIVFVLAFCWRGRRAAMERLNFSGALVSLPQPEAWTKTQLWARRYTPRSSLFLASEPGFRVFSKRAVFLDAEDERWRTISPAVAKSWNNRQWMASRLWGDGESALDNAQWLKMLKTYRVTHLVARADWPHQSRSLVLIYNNRYWAIYRLR